MGGHGYGMLQPNNRIRLSVLDVNVRNHMKIKCFIRNRIITMCFSFYEKHISNFTTMFCNIIFFSKCLVYYFEGRQKLVTSQFFTFIAKLYPANYFLVEIRKHNTNFSIFSSLLLFIIADFNLKVH